MKTYLKFIPWFFLYSRLLIAIFFLVLAFDPSTLVYLKVFVLFLFCFGFIGDILDGIIARALKMDTTLMRRLDSIFDLFFWLTSTYLLYQLQVEIRPVLLTGFTSVISLVALEYLVSIIRFSKGPSSHNLISKFFGLFLFAFYVMGFSGLNLIWFGVFAFSFGFLARLDALLIYTILKEWTHDIPSFYHAIMLRNNRPFKKHKLFHSEHVS